MANIIIREKLAKTTPYSVAVLIILSLVVFEIVSLVLNAFFGFTMVKIGIGFLLMLVAAVTILPHAMIMGDLKISGKEAFLLLLVVVLDLLVIMYFGPKYVPTVFSTMTVTWP